MNIGEKLDAIKQQLPAGCKLIAVSKTHPVDVIQEAYDAGHRIFGENKVQELVPKYEALPKDIEWHLIGHLQSNKVKYIAPFVSWVHSIDSLKLLAEVNKQAQKYDRKINCLLQVHIAEEETKFGFSESELQSLLISEELGNFHNVIIRGLMGMATFTDNKEQIVKEFRTLKGLFEKMKAMKFSPNVEMKELSMGMSGDYLLAVKEGSTMVRVGSAIFGQRNYPVNS